MAATSSPLGNGQPDIGIHIRGNEVGQTERAEAGSGETRGNRLPMQVTAGTVIHSASSVVTPPVNVGGRLGMARSHQAAEQRDAVCRNVLRSERGKDARLLARNRSKCGP